VVTRDEVTFFLHREVLTRHSPFFRELFKRKPELTSYRVDALGAAFHALMLRYYRREPTDRCYRNQGEHSGSTVKEILDRREVGGNPTVREEQL